MTNRRFERFLEFLCEEFKDTCYGEVEIELIYRNFDILKCLIINGDFLSITDVAKLISNCRDIARSKLFKLEKENLISSNRFNRKKYYTSNIENDFINRFEKYTKCYNCGKFLGRNGGILHENIEYETKIYCSKKCKR